MRSAGTSAGVDRDLLEARRLDRAERLRLAALAARRRRDRGRGALQVALAEPVDVREVARLAADHADPGAALGAALDVLDPRLVDRQPEARSLLAEQLGEVAAVGERPLHHPLGEPGLDQRRAPPPRAGQRSASSASSGHVDQLGGGAEERAARLGVGGKAALRPPV